MARVFFGTKYMTVRLYDIKLPLGSDERRLAEIAGERLGVAPGGIRDVRIRRRSIDARQKPRVCFVYTLDIDVAESLSSDSLRQLEVPDEGSAWPHPEAGTSELRGRPVVVGAGPAGLLAAFTLAQRGFSPLVIERGKPGEARAADVAEFLASRTLDPESNILFGEGGAGTFSDGKLYTGKGGGRARQVLKLFVQCGAPEDIAYDAKPHVGTDFLRAMVIALREKTEQAGGEFRFGCKATGLAIERGQLAGVKCGGELVESGAVVLAIGHSARDTFEVLLAEGVALERKPFQLGLRIEHPQCLIDRTQYGEAAGHPQLPAADYRLVAKASAHGRSVHSFCMCPGGVVVPAVSEAGGLVTNGMSYRARDLAWANGALVTTAEPKDFGGDGPLAGVEFQRHWERRAFEMAGSNYDCPAQRASDFVRGRTSRSLPDSSYPFGLVSCPVAGALPDFAAEALARALPVFERKLRGFLSDRALLLGPETRASSPVRIVRSQDTRESVNLPGLYPVGEGAGYAGGIMSSAIDGILTAEQIVRRFAPPRG